MKKFHISDVLSVTTPYLFSTRHIEGVYDILGFLCGESLYTHQLGRVQNEVEPWLRTQFPQLMEDSPEMAELLKEFKAGLEQASSRKEYCINFVEMVRSHFHLPEYLSIYEMSEDMHLHVDPKEELESMVGSDKVISINLSKEEGIDEQN